MICVGVVLDGWMRRSECLKWYDTEGLMEVE